MSIPEQNLWRAVLAQAVSDATNPSQAEEYRRAGQQARSWIEGASRDYQMVCSLAGVDAASLRERYFDGTLTYIKQNRQAAGK